MLFFYLFSLLYSLTRLYCVISLYETLLIVYASRIAAETF
jgi:hypothetical protein